MNGRKTAQVCGLFRKARVRLMSSDQGNPQYQQHQGGLTSKDPAIERRNAESRVQDRQPTSQNATDDARDDRSSSKAHTGANTLIA
jgi:hypothetical protein